MAAPAVPAFVSQRFEPLVPLDRLTPHPANPNEGDVGLLCDLLDANGFAGAVMAQESTGILIDGETRWRAAVAKGLPGLPVIWCDVDDDTRDRLLAEWNESTRRGRNDEGKLIALLQGLAMTPRGLEGAAFDGDDLDALIARMNPEPPEGFKEYDENIPMHYRCPRCGYEGSGDAWKIKPEEGGGDDGGSQDAPA